MDTTAMCKYHNIGKGDATRLIKGIKDKDYRGWSRQPNEKYQLFFGWGWTATVENDTFKLLDPSNAIEVEEYLDKVEIMEDGQFIGVLCPTWSVGFAIKKSKN